MWMSEHPAISEFWSFIGIKTESRHAWLFSFFLDFFQSEPLVYSYLQDGCLFQLDYRCSFMSWTAASSPHCCYLHIHDSTEQSTLCGRGLSESLHQQIIDYSPALMKTVGLCNTLFQMLHMHRQVVQTKPRGTWSRTTAAQALSQWLLMF